MKIFTSSRAVIILAIVYFAFPLDLVPDFFSPIGRIDDLAILGLALIRALRYSARPTSTASTSKDNAPNKPAKDPFDIFGLPQGASKDAIEARYKQLVKDYHPDRVAHLGEELRKVAHEKMVEVQGAYRVLMQGAM